MIQSSYLFFDLFLLFVCWIEDRSQYYNINIRYTYVFKFCYNDIWLWFFPCFGEKSEMIYILLISLSFSCLNTQRWLQKLNQSCVYINRTIQQHSIYITPTRQPLKDGAILGSAERGEVDIDSDVNCTASGNIRKSTTVPIQCEQLPWTWTWRLMYFDCWSHFETLPGIFWSVVCKKL